MVLQKAEGSHTHVVVNQLLKFFSRCFYSPPLLPPPPKHCLANTVFAFPNQHSSPSLPEFTDPIWAPIHPHCATTGNSFSPGICQSHDGALHVCPSSSVALAFIVQSLCSSLLFGIFFAWFIFFSDSVGNLNMVSTIPSCHRQSIRSFPKGV